MKTAKDLQKIWEYIKKRYGEGVSFEILEKQYPESIMQGAKIVDSIRLFVNWNGWRFTTWRMDKVCSDATFFNRTADLFDELDYYIKGEPRKQKANDLPF